MKLHEAMIKVLKANGNKPMTIEEIAFAINQQNLYIKRDGSRISAYNVGLRAISDISKGTKPVFDVLIKIRD